jgi:hypothetical protein
VLIRDQSEVYSNKFLDVIRRRNLGGGQQGGINVANIFYTKEFLWPRSWRGANKKLGRDLGQGVYVLFSTDSEQSLPS